MSTTATAVAAPLDDQLAQAAGQLKQVIADTYSTLIVLVLDGSGSMTPLRQTVIDGINDFIEEQKQTPGKAFVSLTVFDTVPEYRYEAIALEDFPTFTKEDYRTGGGTALFDAIGLTVEKSEKWIADQPKAPQNVLFVIFTDGEENSSTDFDSGKITKLIDKKTEQNWDFTYLGANQDAILAARMMHIPVASAANFTATQDGTFSALKGVSRAVTSYRSAAPGKRGSFYEDDDL